MYNFIKTGFVKNKKFAKLNEIISLKQKMLSMLKTYKHQIYSKTTRTFDSLRFQSRFQSINHPDKKKLRLQHEKHKISNEIFIKIDGSVSSLDILNSNCRYIKNRLPLKHHQKKEVFMHNNILRCFLTVVNILFSW